VPNYSQPWPPWPPIAIEINGISICNSCRLAIVRQQRHFHKSCRNCSKMRYYNPFQHNTNDDSTKKDSIRIFIVSGLTNSINCAIKKDHQLIRRFCNPVHIYLRHVLGSLPQFQITRHFMVWYSYREFHIWLTLEKLPTWILITPFQKFDSFNLILYMRTLRIIGQNQSRELGVNYIHASTKETNAIESGFSWVFLERFVHILRKRQETWEADSIPNERRL
jgi:hypothetical protein